MSTVSTNLIDGDEETERSKSVLPRRPRPPLRVFGCDRLRACWSFVTRCKSIFQVTAIRDQESCAAYETLHYLLRLREGEISHSRRVVCGPCFAPGLSLGLNISWNSCAFCSSVVVDAVGLSPDGDPLAVAATPNKTAKLKALRCFALRPG